MKQLNNLKHICKEWLNKKMCGILPIYADFGVNGSQILFEDKPPLTYDVRVETVARNLAQLYCKDISLIKQKVSKITYKRTGNPLPILEDIILIPIKVRKPLAKDDGSFGYIFKSGISKVDKEGKCTYIYLKNGQRIKVLESFEVVNQRIMISTYVAKKLLPVRTSIEEFEEHFKEHFREFLSFFQFSKKLIEKKKKQENEKEDTDKEAEDEK